MDTYVAGSYERKREHVSAVLQDVEQSTSTSENKLSGSLLICMYNIGKRRSMK